ncbi:MAG: shikimate kinase [archaeon]
MNKNLLLIGYRGTGKTAIGKLIASKLEKEFIDTDKLIVEIAGKSIPQIFSEDGEESFRSIETKALEIATNKENVIISCGGGIIVKERNFELLLKGIVCLLTADAKTIYNRIYNDSNRPALTNKDPFEEINHLLELRGPLYQKAKDFEIDSAKNNIIVCTNQIIKKFNELNNL